MAAGQENEALGDRRGGGGGRRSRPGRRGGGLPSRSEWDRTCEHPALSPAIDELRASRIQREHTVRNAVTEWHSQPSLRLQPHDPGQLARGADAPGTDPFVIGRPSGPSLTAPFLLDRRVFTARSPQEWFGAAGVVAPAWDLDVQVWDRQGRTAIEWARAFPCDDPSVTLGQTKIGRAHV